MSDYVWKVFSPGELELLTPGEEVLIRTIEWRNGKQQVYFSEQAFLSYSPYRGIVEVERVAKPENARDLETSYCEAAVGRSAVPEHYELHGDFNEEV